MQSFINELSLPVLSTSEKVIEVFSELGVCYRRCREMGLREIKMHSTFFNHLFAPNYTFGHWLADYRVDDDLRTLFKGVMSTIPFVDEILLSYEQENDLVLQMTYNGSNSIGLGLASDAIYKTVSLSYSYGNWTRDQYTVRVVFGIEDESGNFKEDIKEATVLHIANIAHAESHIEFINSYVGSSIENGRQLWLRRMELFPNLDFCSVVENQIRSLNNTMLGFQQIIERLFDLQNTALKCDGNPIKPSSFPTHTSPESTSREQSIGSKLSFKCPDGVDRLFTWHSRFTPNAGRIHFVPFESEKKFLIGYIGKKIV
jgi:hypothetical protein